MKKASKGLKFIDLIIVGMFICVTAYLIYNIYILKGIENLIRYIVMVVLIIISLIALFICIRLRKKKNIIKHIIFILILILIGTGEFFISNIINRGINVIDNISKDEKTYTSALVTLKNGEYSNIKKINDADIAIISNTDDTEGYILAQELIKKYKISEEKLIQYDDYVSMLSDLYDEDIDAAFITGSYVDTYSSMDKFTNIDQKLIVLDKYSKVMKKQVDSVTQTNTKKVTEPFSLLLLGVDSTDADISKTSGLGDTIMLVTFNPNTLNATIFSIPRDTYVPISCFNNYKNKITHAAIGGDSCMIKTVQNFTGITIDYYAKMNFRGLINLVDALGGIDVDVPYAFCETDENRSSKNIVLVEKGLQHLDGRQALALSRNRKTIDWCGPHYNQGTRNDFVRGQNQQLVVNGIINKAKTIKSVNKLYEILDTVSISLDTNLTRDQILDFYNVFKKIVLNSDSLSDMNNIINIQKTYLNGSSAMIYDKRSGLVLYNFVPSQASLNAIVKAMKVNLGLAQEEYKKSFSFSIDNPYKSAIIGSDQYGGSSVTLLPDFTGKTKSYVSSYCISNGINVSFKEENVSSTSGYSQDQVISQSLPASYNLEDIKETLVITVANINSSNKETDKKDDKEDSETSSYKNKCVKEGNDYYWYDSNGDKNPTKYSDSTCSTKKDNTTEEPKEDNNENSEKDNNDDKTDNEDTDSNEEKVE